MKLQFNGFSCGVIATMAALEALGCVADYDDIKRVAGTNYKEGTTRQGVIRAVSSKGFRATPYHTRNPDNAWRWLKSHATSSSFVVLVDECTHWIACIGVIDDKLIMVDGSPKDGDNGVSVVGKQDALARMVYSLGHYYAIRISRV